MIRYALFFLGFCCTNKKTSERTYILLHEWNRLKIWWIPIYTCNIIFKENQYFSSLHWLMFLSFLFLKVSFISIFCSAAFELDSHVCYRSCKIRKSYCVFFCSFLSYFFYISSQFRILLMLFAVSISYFTRFRFFFHFFFSNFSLEGNEINNFLSLCSIRQLKMASIFHFFYFIFIFRVNECENYTVIVFCYFIFVIFSRCKYLNCLSSRYRTENIIGTCFVSHLFFSSEVVRRLSLF